jgi:CoA:oxalate CoA-transferase
MTPEGPFSGLFVLDLTRILAGRYCTMLLDDLGARVVQVEPPEGDESRRYGPFINGKSPGPLGASRRAASDLDADHDRILGEL